MGAVDNLKTKVYSFRNPQAFAQLRVNDDAYVSEGVKFLIDKCGCCELIHLIADKQHDLLIDKQAYMQKWVVRKVGDKWLVTCSRYNPTAMGGESLYKCEFEQELPLNWVSVVTIWNGKDDQNLLMLPWEAPNWLGKRLLMIV